MTRDDLVIPLVAAAMLLALPASSDIRPSIGYKRAFGPAFPSHAFCRSLRSVNFRR